MCIWNTFLCRGDVWFLCCGYDAWRRTDPQLVARRLREAGAGLGGPTSAAAGCAAAGCMRCELQAAFAWSRGADGCLPGFVRQPTLQSFWLRLDGCANSSCTGTRVATFVPLALGAPATKLGEAHGPEQSTIALGPVHRDGMDLAQPGHS